MHFFDNFRITVHFLLFLLFQFLFDALVRVLRSFFLQGLLIKLSLIPVFIKYPVANIRVPLFPLHPLFFSLNFNLLLVIFLMLIEVFLLNRLMKFPKIFKLSLFLLKFWHEDVILVPLFDLLVEVLRGLLFVFKVLPITLPHAPLLLLVFQIALVLFNPLQHFLLAFLQYLLLLFEALVENGLGLVPLFVSLGFALDSQLLLLFLHLCHELLCLLLRFQQLIF
mmetsp:Transcript_15034/g.17379  ORF Transcript_15034/g.17379 Transcript_15034/m.17379 type:complete len:223 (-) Transcript_15034:422-1090(-)